MNAETETAAGGEAQPGLDEAQDRYLRLAAQFENYRRSAEREQARAVREERQRLLSELFGPLDDLERALSAQGDAELVVAGLRVAGSGLHSALERIGLRRIGDAGESFDPARHEAIGYAPGAEGTVANVLRYGWQLEDRVVRAALVQIGDGSQT